MSSKPSWLERARKLAEYRREAAEFIGRAADQLPVSPDDVKAIGLLWLEADRLDGVVCAALNEMNAGLADGRGELDSTRGASVRPSTLDEPTLFYDCSWSLQWDGGRRVVVNLAIDPRSTVFEVTVTAMMAAESVSVPFPVAEPELKEALISAYAAEATFDGLST